MLGIPVRLADTTATKKSLSVRSVTMPCVLPHRSYTGWGCKEEKSRSEYGVSERDLKLLRKAAATLWQGIPITNSTLLLTLAKLKATEVLTQAREMVPARVPLCNLARQFLWLSYDRPQYVVV